MFIFKNNAITRALVKITTSADFTSARIIALFLNLNIIMQNYTYTITPK